MRLYACRHGTRRCRRPRRDRRPDTRAAGTDRAGGSCRRAVPAVLLVLASRRADPVDRGRASRRAPSARLWRPRRLAGGARSHSMPLTAFQKDVLAVLAANRSEERHFARGSLLNAADDSPRFSRDFDVVHDVTAEVVRASEHDVASLRAARVSVETLSTLRIRKTPSGSCASQGTPSAADPQAEGTRGLRRTRAPRRSWLQRRRRPRRPPRCSSSS